MHKMRRRERRPKLPLSAARGAAGAAARDVCAKLERGIARFALHVLSGAAGRARGEADRLRRRSARRELLPYATHLLVHLDTLPRGEGQILGGAVGLAPTAGNAAIDERVDGMVVADVLGVHVRILRPRKRSPQERLGSQRKQSMSTPHSKPRPG